MREFLNPNFLTQNPFDPTLSGDQLSSNRKPRPSCYMCVEPKSKSLLYSFKDTPVMTKYYYPADLLTCPDLNKQSIRLGNDGTGNGKYPGNIYQWITRQSRDLPPRTMNCGHPMILIIESTQENQFNMQQRNHIPSVYHDSCTFVYDTQLGICWYQYDGDATKQASMNQAQPIHAIIQHNQNQNQNQDV